jgi:hypothetical protein
MRYTSDPASTTKIDLARIPLLHYHIDRLRAAHAHFRDIQGQDVWGPWLGGEAIERELIAKLNEVGAGHSGDWRVGAFQYLAC